MCQFVSDEEFVTIARGWRASTQPLEDEDGEFDVKRTVAVLDLLAEGREIIDRAVEDHQIALGL